VSGTLLGLLAFACAAGYVVLLVRSVRRVDVGARRGALNGLALGAVGFGIAAFLSGPGLLGGVLAGLGTLVGAIFLVLTVQAPQSQQAPAVAVGGRLLDFTAPDENGKPFSLESLHGRPVLIKFFRGHW